MTITNRKKQVQVANDGKRLVRRQVVEDTGREYQSVLVRVIQIMWLGVIALEALLGVRVLLKLSAADPSVVFASFIYQLSGLFLIPFNGLTITPSANGVVFEVPTIIAMAVYALAGWLLTQFVWLVFKTSKHRSRTIEEINRDL